MLQPRLVKSLATLRAQVNQLAPKRSKVSDGWIGDTKHAARKSQHNPDGDGTVDAVDITHDPKNGMDADKLAEAIRTSKDKRVGYVIYNSRIFSGATGKQPFVWRKYTGANAHTKHVHIDVIDKHQDDTTPWKIDAAFGKASPVAKPAPNLTEKQKSAVMRRGSKGEFVTELQGNLNSLGYGPLTADGVFGASTARAVKKFQSKAGLQADGWAGPRTLGAIGKAIKDQELRPVIKEAEKQVPAEAKKEVEKKTNLWTSITSGLATAGAFVTAMTGLEWQVVVAIGATGFVAILLLLFLRHQIIAAFKEINAEAAR